jgi:ferric-dicitrate binding protein FerR (iron transport regulator)
MKTISQIIAHSLLKMANKEEKDTLAKWKNLSTQNEIFADGLEAYWKKPGNPLPDKRLQHARKRLLVRINSNREEKPQRTRFGQVWRIAAAVAAVVTISGISIYIASVAGVFHTKNYVEVATEAGQRSKVTLPDGSLVWLNAETDIKYSLLRNKRTLILSGEAYFEVKHDPDQPFIVKTGDAKIIDLGTKFNVSHYPDSKIIQTSLLSGKISMSLSGNNEGIKLIPGQKLTYDEEQHKFIKTTANVHNEVLWREGVLIFDNELFSDLINKLERYYAVKIIYDRTSFQNKHYTGTINNLSIDKVLDFISLTIPMKYEINNKTITLTYKNDN